MKGKIHPSTAAILRFDCGSARIVVSAHHGGKGDESYDLSTGASGSPCIRSQQTGKYWTITWRELIGMAVSAGIDADDEQSEVTK